VKQGNPLPPILLDLFMNRLESFLAAREWTANYVLEIQDYIFFFCAKHFFWKWNYVKYIMTYSYLPTECQIYVTVLYPLMAIHSNSQIWFGHLFKTLALFTPQYRTPTLPDSQVFGRFEVSHDCLWCVNQQTNCRVWTEHSSEPYHIKLWYRIRSPKAVIQ
jgi:hypothetical protein